MLCLGNRGNIRSVIIIVVVIAVGLFSGLLLRSSSKKTKEPAVQEYHKIISFAPSITEILFSIGAGDRIIAATDFCNYPPETSTIPRIGGHLNPSWEAIFSLKPDLFIMLPSASEHIEALETRGITCLVVPDETLDDLYKSINLIGAVTGNSENASNLVDKIESSITELSSKMTDYLPKRVLFVAGRQPGTLNSIFSVSSRTWLGALLKKLNALNIAGDVKVPYPELSMEQIISKDPEIIIESRPELADDADAIDDATEEWYDLKDITAVKKGNVFILTDSGLTIPGPRIINTIKKLASIIHSDFEFTDNEQP